ncbi:PE-PGRS protein, putative [Trichomonas vaginalis G3]|uniref:receptor protein-tyrosine kinase n=1 Tax=Trichomonas vaginalis (strain ATCC PRA-98 / G3) TaxID=412133 RepID=A2DI77_TRIV3|nr:glycine-rich protein family [Trichomonas vaginalis G3]EAY19873.1 PE-PGRS protein, putative [Trichomonas vaginalis G3]KAI5509999.1 glycine-rich protein family [Trichomonas vaginalis G3]|eukprot:XP_001580859.1 PE-PGRS protein [Trichomonas vaginalis G3]
MPMLLLFVNIWQLRDQSKGVLRITLNGNETLLRYPCQNTHDCTYYFSKLEPGYYLIELWGANGGGSYTNGKFYDGRGIGGYSRGVMQLNYPSDVYVYIGGKGENGKNPSTIEVYGGFNGGGNSPRDNDNDSDDQGGGGGGATDIRVNGTSYINRIIIAGGAGENGFDTGYYDLSPSYGGGFTGSPPIENNGNGISYGVSADQNRGYSFGEGQNGVHTGGTSGGGGLFGGYTIKGEVGGQGGGGSGYIGGVISYKNIIPTTIPGNSNFPSKPCNDKNGCARITLIEYIKRKEKPIRSCPETVPRFACRFNIRHR